MILCLVCFEKGPIDCSEIAREKKKEESQSSELLSIKALKAKFRAFVEKNL